MVYLPDNEDVGVFLGGIVSLLQGWIFCLGGWVLVEPPWETAHGSAPRPSGRVTRAP